MFTIRGTVVNQYTRAPMTMNGSDIPAQKFVQLMGTDHQGRSTIQDVAIEHKHDFSKEMGQEIEAPVNVFAQAFNGRGKLKIVYNSQG